MGKSNAKKRGHVIDSSSSQTDYKSLIPLIGFLKEKYNLNKQELSKFEALTPLINFFKEKHNLTKEELVDLFEATSEIRVPLSIFSMDLSPLESLVKYLKENLGLRFHEIASNLNRYDRSIWHTYSHVKSKSKVAFELKKESYFIPISIFRNRKLSVLENLVVYLKDNVHLTVKKISVLLNKSVSTILTAYNRAKKKVKNE